MNDTCDIAIIGGGAAGLAAAIFAAQTNRQKHVVILDGAKSIGAKILVSGGARCNVTHDYIAPNDYNAPAHFVRHVLAAFDEQDAVAWFAEMGVDLKREETGKLFPVTDSSKTVLAALLRRCEQLKVEIKQSCRVVKVEARDRSADGATPRAAFLISHNQGELLANKVIMATGGRSLPLTGSDGAGWAMVKVLGHTVTPTYPALVPLILESSFFHADLSGLAMEVELSTFAKGKRIDHRTGSLLWTHFGISGPVVMDASRHWVITHANGQDAQMKCSLLPGRDFAAVEKLLIDRAAQAPKRPLSAALADQLPGRMVQAIIESVWLNPSTPLGQVSREDRRALVHALTALVLPVVRDRGWNYAEVTAGGVPVNEVHHRDLQSRLIPGLFLIGEMLDCDGRIGGFNFQWAWSTGFLAGTAAAKDANVQ